MVPGADRCESGWSGQPLKFRAPTEEDVRPSDWTRKVAISVPPGWRGREVGRLHGLNISGRLAAGKQNPRFIAGHRVRMSTLRLSSSFISLNGATSRPRPWCILNACFGISEEVRVSRPPHSSSPREKNFIRDLQQTLVAPGQATRRPQSSANGDAVSMRAKTFCASRRKNQMVAAEAAFECTSCRRCSEQAGRMVWYCSRDCQMEDWRAGHKKHWGSL